jgi:RNA 2',3'-cyclic 3'-phosphodiesterase
MMKIHRTFIALPLPEQIITELKVLQQYMSGYDDGISWVRPELMHITLKFLGETPDRMLEKIRRAFTQSCREYAPFRLTLDQTGVFPREGDPRVLWVGLHNIPGSLYRLSDELNAIFVSMGFDDSGKRFSPHITLGRVKRKTQPGMMQRFLSAEPDRKEFISERIIWYDSCHKNGKLTYIPLEECQLQ